MQPMYLYYFTREENFPIFIQYGFHDEDMALHTHADFYELVIVMNGSATHIVNNEEYQIHRGDVFVIGNDIAHGYTNPSDFQICNIMFQPEIVFQPDYDIKLSSGFHALFIIEPCITKDSRFQSRLKLNYEAYEKLSQLIDSMIDCSIHKTNGWKTSLLSGFLQIVVFLCNEYTLPHTVPKDSLLNLALPVAYIQKQYANNISIEKLAELSMFSVRHFSRLFQQTYQISPLQYILKVRIHHACSLLSQTTLPVSNIAFSCGFGDSNYFSRQFKKMTGISPIDYRNFTSHVSQIHT